MGDDPTYVCDIKRERKARDDRARVVVGTMGFLAPAFPWVSHLSLAEVAEFETLVRLNRDGLLSGGKRMGRLRDLNRRARPPLYEPAPKGAA